MTARAWSITRPWRSRSVPSISLRFGACASGMPACRSKTCPAISCAAVTGEPQNADGTGNLPRSDGRNGICHIESPPFASFLLIIRYANFFHKRFFASDPRPAGTLWHGVRYMEQQYKGPVTDRRIRELFADAGDFNYRTVEICGFPVHTYAIDGLTSGGDISDFVIRPLLENLQGNSMQELYQRALQTVVYNSVADVRPDLDTAARKLVNGFCVVLFEGTGAIAFEDKTEEKRSPSRPEVENTVKGPKDAFTETIRTNTSLIRRHLRTPELQLYESRSSGRRSLTNVAIVGPSGGPDVEPELVRRLEAAPGRRSTSTVMVSPAVGGGVSHRLPRDGRSRMTQYHRAGGPVLPGVCSAGRVGLLVDGLPLGLSAARGSWAMLMQTPEDRGADYVSGHLRPRASAIWPCSSALLLPAALCGHHVPSIQEMIPDAAAAGHHREQARRSPFRRCWRSWALLIAFELLQEAGIQPAPVHWADDHHHRRLCRRQRSRARRDSFLRRPWSPWPSREFAGTPCRGRTFPMPCGCGAFCWPSAPASRGCLA